ncbi:MAG: alkaline phosphatase family protein [Planctomycetota bacterium]
MHLRTSIAACCRAAAFVVVLAFTAYASSPEQGRLIVLGFDGADARTVEKLMDEGQLPNLAKLRAQGTFAPLGTTTPAESPVSWASLNCGQNPAKTGIPGFVMRTLDGGSPQPTIGHQEHATRATRDMDIHPIYRWLLAGEPMSRAVWAGAAVLVAFFVLLRGLLKIRTKTAAALSIVLGAVGASGGWMASDAIPRKIDDIVGNPTKTAGFWESAANAGVPSVVLDAAMAWDRPPIENLKLLAGLGVPDVRGQNGDWFVYTTADKTSGDSPKSVMPPPDGTPTSTAGRVFHVEERDGRIESVIYGPRNLWAIDKKKRELESLQEEFAQVDSGSADQTRIADRIQEIKNVELPELSDRGEAGRMSVPLVVTKLENGARASVSIGGQEQTLAEGDWSKWYHLDFDFNALVKVRAITRVKIAQMQAPFSLYVDFLQMDPAAPPFWQPISAPSSFAGELAKAIDEPYETVGWACMTMPFKDREIDAETFMQDMEFTHTWRERILSAALERGDWRLFMNVESTPDRVQHMMYQYYDPQHPLYDATRAARKIRYFGQEIALADAIPATYRQMDALVGQVVEEHVGPNDTLLICSDHGFQSFRRGVNLNNWLAEKGYLKVREDFSSRRQADALQFVDWEHTQAYALGLGMIFLNLESTHPEGTVSDADAPALLEKLARDLMDTVDPKSDEKAVRAVYRMADVHSGPHLDREADIMPGFAAGYRVSWSTTLGNLKVVKTEDGTRWVPGPTFEDNTNNWSGDHVSVAEDLVRGVFFSNRKVKVPDGGVSLLHIAPTALKVLGVPIPAEYDLAPLEFL